MALVADIATCRVRQWSNIVVFLAAPVRAAPTQWLDDGLVRDGSTNYIHRDNFLRPDLVTTIDDKDGYFLKNCFTELAGGKKPHSAGEASPFPKFTLEFLADVSEPSSELSWVDLNMFLTRLREAVLESSRLQEVAAMAAKGLVAEANNVSAARFRTTGTSIVLMLDAAYRPEAAHESVDFITNTREGFYCDPTVGMSDADRKNRAASEGKLSGPQQDSLRLMIDVDEKHLFAPPRALMDTLASLSLHEAVAYGTIAALTPFTNFTVFVSPRRNYFVEKAVRQSLQKAAWSLEEGSKREVPIKTPAAALEALLVTASSAPKSAFAGLAPVAAPSVNNPRLVGFSDFVRCFMEGYFSAMATDGKVPTADVSLDKMNDPAASLIAPGIRGSVENSAFWCGRMTAASTALFLARHPQMMGFADVVLPAADGSTMAPLSSGMSMASTASPGSKVPTTNTPLVAFMSRGVLNDTTFFSQMSLAPRGAPSAVSPPLLLMPSQKHLRHCEEVLVPAIRTAGSGSCFHRVVTEAAEGALASANDLAPVLQAMGWNGDLLRHFTDGLHYFSVPTLLANPSEAAIKRISGDLSVTPDRYVDLLAQHFIMRLCSCLLEHGSHSHFGTVASFTEAVRVLTVLREQAVMSIVFLNAPTADAQSPAANAAVWVRALEYLASIFSDVSETGSGEARISIILVPSPAAVPAAEDAALALPACLSSVINTIALPPPSTLDTKTAFRSKWVLPFAPTAVSGAPGAHALYSNTFGESWPYVSPNADGAEEGGPMALEKKAAILSIVAIITDGVGPSASPQRTPEEVAKAMVPSSLAIGGNNADSASPNAAELYQSLPEGYIAPLLRYLVLTSAAAAEPKTYDFTSAADVVGAVATAVLTPSAVSRRIAPTSDVASVALVLKAIRRTIAAGEHCGGATVGPLNAIGVDGVTRVPTATVFGAFDEMLQSSQEATPARRLQFARVWTLFHDTLALLGFSGLITAHSAANGAAVAQYFSPHLYAATGTSSNEAAAALRSDSAADVKMYAALFDDLQPFIEVNPLVSADVLAAMAGESTDADEGCSAADAFKALTFRSPPAASDSAAPSEERLLFATIAGHRMRFSQTSLWTRYIAAAEAALTVVEGHIASRGAPSTVAAQALGIVCFDVLDTLFVSNVSQLMPLLHVLPLLKRATKALETVVGDASLRSALLLPEGEAAQEAAPKGLTVRLVDLVGALRRARGYSASCAYACEALLPDGSRGVAAVMSPSAGEWWLLLAHTSELLDGNVGRPITAAHLAAAAEGAARPSKAGDAPAIAEYDFGEEPEGSAERSKASERPDEIDPRLRDLGCPIAPIAANRPSTAVATSTEALRAIISAERPPRVQFMQQYEREDFGGDEPNSIEELDSDADEDDVAELNARLASQEVKRRAALEANQAGILLATDQPVTDGGKSYYRGSTKDAIMLVAVGGGRSFPWRGDGGAEEGEAAAGSVGAAVSCLSYVDGILFAGHVDGSITSRHMDTSVPISSVPSSTHGAPVTDIIPYGRSYTDMGNHNYYLTHASGIRSNPDDAEAADPKAPAEACTAIVTASKSNRCIRLWPSNSLEGAAPEPITILDNAKSVRLKDPMSRCFFVRLARRGVDEVQLRQNVGNPEEMTNRRKRDLLTLLSTTANKGRKAPIDEPLDAEEEALAAAVAPVLERAQVAPGANDTVLVMYGASAQGTQHAAEERYNDNAFVGTDGVWQHTLSLTVPPGYEVTAAAVGPGPKGEARLAVAVSSLSEPERHYLQQFEIARSR